MFKLPAEKGFGFFGYYYWCELDSPQATDVGINQNEPQPQNSPNKYGPQRFFGLTRQIFVLSRRLVLPSARSSQDRLAGCPSVPASQPHVSRVLSGCSSTPAKTRLNAQVSHPSHRPRFSLAFCRSVLLGQTPSHHPDRH